MVRRAYVEEGLDAHGVLSRLCGFLASDWDGHGVGVWSHHVCCCVEVAARADSVLSVLSISCLPSLLRTA